MGKCLFGAKLEHHCSSPLIEVSKNACSCQLHSAIVTKICAVTTLTCLDVIAKLRNVTIWFLTYVLPPAWNSYAPTGRIFKKFDIWNYFFLLENLSTEITFQSNL